MRIVIVGSGNVAWALSNALTASGNAPVQIFSRNVQQGSSIAAESCCGYTSRPEELAAADLYIIAVSDRAVGPVSDSLDFGSGVVAHTAAGVDTSELSAGIAHKAVLYPLQTFTKGRPVDMVQVPFYVEGETPHALETVRKAASALSGRVVEKGRNERVAAHLAAVFASNFTNYMYTVAKDVMTASGQDFSLLAPLITETALKAVESGDPAAVQTGPAVRNDFRTKSLHGEMLAVRADLKNLYINLSNNIWETSKKR